MVMIATTALGNEWIDCHGVVCNSNNNRPDSTFDVDQVRIFVKAT